MNKNYTLVFIVGVVIGLLLSMLVIPQLTVIQEIAVRKLFEKGVESVSYGEEHRIDLKRMDRELPQLSITKVRLTDHSGSEKYELRSSDEGIIECTIKNIGGTAEDIVVNWQLKEPKKLPEQLKLAHPIKAISELKKNSSKVYKISVKTIDMEKVGHFKINLYSFHKGQRTYGNPKEFDFDVAPKLEGE